MVYSVTTTYLFITATKELLVLPVFVQKFLNVSL